MMMDMEKAKRKIEKRRRRIVAAFVEGTAPGDIPAVIGSPPEFVRAVLLGSGVFKCWDCGRALSGHNRTGFCSLCSGGLRAVAYASGDQGITVAALLQRDGRQCGICGQAMGESQRLSIDHIIPVSRGGSHTWGNIRAAHLTCNVSRGNERHLSLDEIRVALPPEEVTEDLAM